MSEDMIPRPLSRSLWAAAGAVALVFAGAIMLWVHYGATLFFETIRAGFVACFG